MANELKHIGAHNSSRRRNFWTFVVGLLVVALIAGTWVLYSGIAVSLQAEENLHATLFAIRLVEQFVHERGRWPESWAQLEELKFPADAPSPSNNRLNVVRIGGSHGFDWPAQSSHLQQCTVIDFAIDTAVVVNQDPLQFEAIRPIGPHYEYRDYGFVESLQETLKQAATNEGPH